MPNQKQVAQYNKWNNVSVKEAAKVLSRNTLASVSSDEFSSALAAAVNNVLAGLNGEASVSANSENKQLLDEAHAHATVTLFALVGFAVVNYRDALATASQGSAKDVEGCAMAVRRIANYCEMAYDAIDTVKEALP
ncbi:MAG: hypothetical protein KGL90_00760 [Burkholderiales bacterium]|nr:hypothetical protein [Burkholderiales bacterium]